MSDERLLQGGCSCGRNRYTILIPQGANEVAQVFFDNSHAHRKSQASPLSAWVRVPITWISSSTHAQFEDETHSSIRKSYTSPTETSSKRHFCGFCGTPLSYWTELPSAEANYICLTLGSLDSGDLRDLEELGLLPKEVYEDVENDKGKIESVVASPTGPLNVDAKEGLPWFESLVEGSKLGSVSRGRGVKKVGGGRFTVEWEIMEWTEADEEDRSPGKRKLEEVEVHENTMEH